MAEQLRQQNLAHSGIILEPIGRNTAPAIALAALYASNKGGRSVTFGFGCGSPHSR
ncbi:Mannose-1-phosphate guanylyltransferase 1 (part 2) [Candidatus Hamiltonella defensa (Bemisia tabaci)]|nr:Mannose-1-phosphate guanylyltransferase 1 (part 2) [Candidatus Hamiltonella defensa (Bemisia tabaci)]